MSTDTKIEERVVTALKPPKLWKVIILNDDHTTMELVIILLETIFKHSSARAKEITLEIHETGSGVAGTYPYEIAEQKVIEATSIARQSGSPLKIHLEENE